jgi:nucleoid-associated protein EbfC
MFNNLGNLADLMRNAGKIQESIKQATEQLGQIQVEGDAGGGAVSAKANGRLEIQSIRIDPKLLADGDAELLEDLVASAVNQALVKAREAAAKSFSSVAGGLPLPGGLAGLFGPGGPGGGGS